MTKFESLLNSYTGECYAHANGCERRAEWVESNRAELIAYVAALEAQCERLTRENAAVYHHYLGVGTTVAPGSLMMFRRWLAGDDPCTPAPTDAECVAIAAGEG